MAISNQEPSHILVPIYQRPFPLDLNRVALLVIDMQIDAKGIENAGNNYFKHNIEYSKALVEKNFPPVIPR
jgi:hypothetical protein